MNPSALFDRLRPGLDANGSTWAMLRYPQDWRRGQMTGLTLDPAAGALRLAPVPPSAKLAGWYPGEAVTGSDGTRYRVEPATCQLLKAGNCDPGFVPLPAVGGRGFATGRFDRPTSVAIDARDRLYVADSGNARVQIVLPATGEVLAVLDEGLIRPVHVAIGRNGTIFVADEATRAVHRFDPRFAPAGELPLRTLEPWTLEPWREPPAAHPRAIAVLEDGSIAIFDPYRAMLWHMTATGDPLPAISWPGEDRLFAGWRTLPPRFVPRGEIVLGPIDGGSPQLAWHKILPDAQLPEGCSLEIQSFACDREDAEIFPWAPERPVPVSRAETGQGTADRLILADQQGWILWKGGRMLRADPVIQHFDALPRGVTELNLPFAAASRLRAGDEITIGSAQGDRWNAIIAAVGASRASLCAAGPAHAFTRDGPLQLVERDGRPLPYGALDLAPFGVDRASLAVAALTRDGRPQDVDLPHDLAALLKEGDILSLGGGGTIEVLALTRGETRVTLDAPTPSHWHAVDMRVTTTPRRLLVAADLAPMIACPGTRLTVMGDAEVTESQVTALAGDTIWLAAPLGGAVDAANWVAAQFPAPTATDRGRYLWLRIRFVGAALPPGTGVGYALEASATPELRAIRILAPRPNLLDLLPALFARGDLGTDPPGANFMERFLSLFEGEMTRIETIYDSVSRLLNPDAADAEWLAFIASWLDLSFDPSWPIERRRQLVREGAALKAGQGTAGALRRYLEIYTGRAVSVSEGFRRRPPPPIQLGARGALGVAPLASRDMGQDDALAHRFSVIVDLPQGEARIAARSAVLKIIDTMKPAHTRCTLGTRSGVSARVGMDAVIGEIAIPGPAADPCACDPAETADRERSGNVAQGFLVGARLGRGGAREPLTNAAGA